MTYSRKPTRLMRAAIDDALLNGGGKLQRGTDGIWSTGPGIDSSRGFATTTILALERWGFVRITKRSAKEPSELAGYPTEVEVVKEALRQGVPPEYVWRRSGCSSGWSARSSAAATPASTTPQDDARAMLRRYGMEPP